MAFAAADYQKMWTSELVVNLRQSTLMLGLCTQRGTRQWVAGQNQVNIPAPTRSSIAAAQRDRDADWTAATEWAQTTIAFDTEDRFEESTIVKYEDTIEIPWDAVGVAAEEQRYKLRRKIDTDLYDTIKAGVATADKTTLGTAGSKYISRDAPYAGTGTDAALMVIDGLDMFSVKAARKGAYGEGGSPGMLWCLLPPELFMRSRRGLLDKGMNIPPLNASFFEGRIGGGQIYGGNYAGIDILTNTYEAVPTGSGNWVFLCGMREACAANVRAPLVQNFTPAQNQTTNAPGHLIRQRVSYGFAELDGTMLHEFTVHAD